tara:strand:+ start:1947 stop:2354 length:408 start_codon:yes stop_codon:yes gene_type:complete
MSTVNLSVIRTDTSTPPTMQSQDGVDRGKFCLAWGNIMIDTDAHPLCTKGFNVAAIEDIGTGRFVIHFNNPLPSANYAVAGMVSGTATGTNPFGIDMVNSGTWPGTTTQVPVHTKVYTNVNTDFAYTGFFVYGTT